MTARRGPGGRRGLAACGAALLLLLASRAHGQPRGDDDVPAGAVGRSGSRTLKVREPVEGQLSFALLLERHVHYKVGGLARLPAAPSAAAPRPVAYFTVTTGAALVYDRVVARLDRGVFAPAALAGCGPTGGAAERAVRCAPALRTAATHALAEEAARLRELGVAEAPTALLFADQTLPFASFLQAAYAVALGTAGAPPRLQLAVRSGGQVGTLPFFLLPPRAVRLQRGLTPLILVVRLGGGRITVETTTHYSSGRRAAVASFVALERLAGELKARDPDRTVAFVTADPRTPLGDVVAAMASLRGHYPNVVLGATGPGFAVDPRRSRP